jgi:acetyl-CoA synthetase
MALQINSLAEYEAVYARSVADPAGFWAEQANRFHWHQPWEQVLEWNFREPSVKWFLGGKVNITENALDRHLAERGDQTAFIWEPNNTTTPPRHLTYRDVHAYVCQFANALKQQGIGKGDRVCIYMPMTPELAIAVLACARIGAIHSVVFAGFSAISVADRVKDAQCCAIITSGPKTSRSKPWWMRRSRWAAIRCAPSSYTAIPATRWPTGRKAATTGGTM